MGLRGAGLELGVGLRGHVVRVDVPRQLDELDEVEETEAEDAPEVLEDAVVGVVVELLGRAEGPVAAVGIGAAGFVDAEVAAVDAGTRSP